jgi:LPXTG-site transpeptidase (sortase) family protein
MNFFSRFFILLGLITLLFGGYLIYERTNPKHLAFNNIKNLAGVSNSLPKAVLIPSLDIKLPIFPAKIEKYSWESTTQGVSYLTGSPVPGNMGNSILYGHNWSSLLGRLPAVKPGAKIEIVFSDNTKKTFIVSYTSVVTPDQTHVLSASSDSRITIYTCTGFLDTKRFVATAILL